MDFEESSSKDRGTNVAIRIEIAAMVIAHCF
jgi:hypothetical protein